MLILRNRQRTRSVNLRSLRRTARTLLEELLHLPRYDLGIYLVAAPEMTHLNETFLHHHGSTDVITFDYLEPDWPTEPAEVAPLLHGEIFICVDEAIRQARRFGVSWRSEVVRYLVHGLLHLRGYDDRRAAARRRMKREENRLVRCLVAGFSSA